MSPSGPRSEALPQGPRAWALKGVGPGGPGHYFLKTNFAKKSEVKIDKYKLDLNSREITLDNLTLSLTEKETEIIIFIKSNDHVTIKELQSNVWGYSPNLETHTVETHIYRLRKKMKEKFGDGTFIQNSQKGYKII